MNHRCNMVSNGYTTIRIPADLVAEVDELIGKHGFRSRGEIAKEAIRKLLGKYGQLSGSSILEHFNLNEDGVRILDRSIPWVVDITFKHDGIWCDYCQTDNCRHITFAFSVPEIQKVIRKKHKEGWKLPEV